MLARHIISHSQIIKNQLQRILNNDNQYSSEKDFASAATMFIIDHKLDDAKKLIVVLEADNSKEIINELSLLARENWYRSFADFLGLLSDEFVRANRVDIAELASEALLGTLKFGVRDIMNKLLSVVDKFDLLETVKSNLTEKEISVAPVNPLNQVVSRLRQKFESKESDDDLSSENSEEIVQAFNFYITENKFAWACELLEFCYENSELRGALLEADAVREVTKAMKDQGYTATLRYLASIVKDKEEYKQDFLDVIRL